MSTWLPSHHTFGLLARLCGRPDAGNRLDIRGGANGRTPDLTQVRSAPPTCKRTPHCKDDKHGGGHDGMVEGTAA
ncbi:hypothetical protein BHM03_00026961, partial [Ensete ventricosum]